MFLNNRKLLLLGGQHKKSMEISIKFSNMDRDRNEARENK